MNIVILAAGQGKRMKSALPKVLQTLAGKPLLQHVLNTALELQGKSAKTAPIVVVGHGAADVKEFLHIASMQDSRFGKVGTVLQAEQKGTGHALLQALPKLDVNEPTLVLYGDVPLTSKKTLSKLEKLADGVRGEDSALALLTQNLNNPAGYGRIVRDIDGSVKEIVEEKDASLEQKRIQEINTGIMVLPTNSLKKWLKSLRVSNAQGEYYLTDVIAMAVKDGVPIRTAQADNEYETVGVNSRDQLAALERVHQLNQAHVLMDAGVSLADPARIDVRGTLECGTDVFIDVGCVFEGCVTLAAGTKVGPYCIIRNSVIGKGVIIHPYSHIDGAQVGANSLIGPYARLRPGADLSHDVHIGNFVEVKNSKIAASSKANHLAYVGDSIVGSRVNIGAGTITCNYDGVNKHQTIIEDDVFIGSDTQLVAPVRVGRGATLGAGTTLTKDAPPNQLTVSRAKQISLQWQRPVKKEKKVVTKKVSTKKSVKAKK
ncbi:MULTISPECIES: bifunctional UDP-N-acetylglucosamine diphosphorylase/glucosamine-1-phosphate N-acetyltransferase GlmU [unclassified Polynucleobacter]|uniref:bifunctional UDP-N-acetylglucosamine diphosphorylase/glucosamine-1-phosphate N-acetyltransferase GlmU n=1 Tax=unclassified Polynucleobacter TaxID=2640945 RepID=UPI001BFE5CDD|nr:MULTISPECIES: bifunctional UDP-N-acetylglucosamine diphosphorylase/glucosamine-1-phosphate N-acetyltransferase GlmU [unclassified Polynucleobacter]MBU3559985.1 bifunctional UDP-N-acetylglucosamine diphosphorylase/glucosamine-1-phosphate N-acetyltransferase GlmU [Polynucleobacter sp. Nonnen-W13]QWE30675.1 bifunctional UDP-N-acetylglucosamine diphosphorylase/glucosamine-1-phosphate N-acetyltransferase GlmU [Polynucleobacter sp. Adler-ghost]